MNNETLNLVHSKVNAELQSTIAAIYKDNAELAKWDKNHMVASLLRSSIANSRTRANNLDNLLYKRSFTTNQVLNIVNGDFAVVIRESK